MRYWAVRAASQVVLSRTVPPATVRAPPVSALAALMDLSYRASNCLALPEGEC